jgi:hypothetical protein
MNNTLAAETVAALNQTNIPPSESTLEDLERRLSEPKLIRDADYQPLSDPALIEIVELTAVPLIRSFPVDADLSRVWVTLRRCLRKDLPVLCGRAIRSLRYLASITDDPFLAAEISSALAGLRSESEHA